MTTRALEIPAAIRAALDAGAVVYHSLSGGKDCQAMSSQLVATAMWEGWANTMIAIHMDLGRAEWQETPGHVERIAADNGLALVVVRRPQGDLLQEIEDRMHKLAGEDRPFWPSSAARYCTADQKRSQADKVYRAGAPFWPSAASRYCTAHQKTNQADKAYRGAEIVISAEGIRAEESTTRAKKQPVHLRRQITAQRLQELSVEEALAQRRPGERVAINWYPIFDWRLDEDVWPACGTTAADVDRRRAMYKTGRASGDPALMAAALDGWPCHPAYVYGNVRLSCALCVLGCQGDLENGARHNPAVFLDYLRLEWQGGFTFKNGWALESLIPMLLAEGVIVEEQIEEVRRVAAANRTGVRNE